MTIGIQVAHAILRAVEFRAQSFPIEWRTLLPAARSSRQVHAAQISLDRRKRSRWLHQRVLARLLVVDGVKGILIAAPARTRAW